MSVSEQEMGLHKPALWTKSFIALTLASFLLFLNLQMLLSSFSMHIKSNLYGGDMHVSLATSTFAITAIIARLLTSKWIKRWSRETVLTLGLVVAAASTLLAALPNTVEPLLLTRAIYGLGFGVGSTIIPTLVSQIIPPKRMGEGIGYFGLSTSLAMSIGPAMGMSLMKEYGFTTLAITGAGAVLCMFPMLFLAGAYRLKQARSVTVSGHAGQTEQSHQQRALQKADSSEEVKGSNDKAAGASQSEAHRASPQQKSSVQRSLWRLPLIFPAIMNVLISITYSGILSFIAVYGEELKLSQVGLFFMFNALTVLLVRPIAGRLFDSRGPMLVLMPAALFVIGSLLILSYTTNMKLLIVSALLYGLGFGAIQPTLQAWMLRSASKEEYGAVNGMFYNSTDVGISFGALLLGALATLTSYDMMYRLSSICMMIFLLAIAVLAWKRRKR